VRLLDLRGGPRLVGGRLASSWPVVRGESSRCRRIAPCTADAHSGVCFLPTSALVTAALPHPRQIGFPVGGARYGAFCGSLSHAPGRCLCRHGDWPPGHCHNCSHKHATHHRTSTAGVFPPSPVPEGGPKNSFLPPGKVTSRECAQFVPSRARQPKTVTVSPGFIVASFFQPVLYSTPGP